MPDLTPNIGLKKPTDNEYADIAVINENMDTLDAKVAKRSDLDALSSSAIAKGTTNQDVSTVTAVIQRVDTRGNSYTYDATTGNLTQMVEKDGGVAVKTTNYTYDPATGYLTQEVEVVGGKTVTITYTYDTTTGNLKSDGRSVQ